MAESPGLSVKERKYYLSVRESLLMQLRAVEDLLDMPRSVETKREAWRSRLESGSG